MLNSKIENNEEFTRKELLMTSLLCFMNSKENVEINILNSANIITNIPGLNEDLTQFIKGIVLILCDKFVEDKWLSREITNKVGFQLKR